MVTHVLTKPLPAISTKISFIFSHRYHAFVRIFISKPCATNIQALKQRFTPTTTETVVLLSVYSCIIMELLFYALVVQQVSSYHFSEYAHTSEMS